MGTTGIRESKPKKEGILAGLTFILSRCFRDLSITKVKLKRKAKMICGHAQYWLPLLNFTGDFSYNFRMQCSYSLRKTHQISE